MVRKRIAAFLGEICGVEIIGQAENSQQTLDYFKELIPGAVILDIQLADGGAFRVLESLERDERAPIVIASSDDSSPIYEKKCGQLGADFFFHKTKEFDKVMETLARLATYIASN